jgi:hypothetical protein
LSRVAKFAKPSEDARRLSMADALLARGVEPSTILAALGLDRAVDEEPLDKYSPDQPRAPVGNPDGGQWVGANSDASSEPRSSSHDERNTAPTGDATQASASADGSPAKEPQRDDLSIVDAAYQGTYHDFLRDQFADVLHDAGNIVLTEVPLVMPGDSPIAA